MSQRAFLTQVVQALDEACVPYMLTGSLVSSMRGRPRATHDVDVVVDVRPEDVGRLTQVLAAPGIYVDEAAVGGDKADFWLLTDDPYDRVRFERRMTVDVLGLKLGVSTPEDTILMKLRWSVRTGGSEKQLSDAAHVYELQAGTLDEDYLDEWAERVGVTEALAAVRRKPDSTRPER